MRTFSKYSFFVVLFVAVWAAAQSATPTRPAPLSIAEHSSTADGTIVATLSNGLTVIVKAKRTSPVVTVRAYVRAGGLYEREWLGCGLSHLTEHLVAKGAVHDMGEGMTAKQAKQTSDRVTAIGGQSNAYTSMAMTCYYISAASGKTNDCIDLISDWMARPEITVEDFRREHGVVQRELEMGKDSVTRQFWYHHMANCFRTHPAAVPVIGYAAPLSKLTRRDVIDYHGRMYVPQNMVICIVGDVKGEAVLKRACRALAGFARRRTPDLTLPEVPHFTGVRRMVCRHKAIKETMEAIAFQTIPLVHRDLYALDVLAYVLTRGGSSRLIRAIQRQQRLVTSINAGSWTPQWGRGVFDIQFRCEPNKADAAERAIFDQLKAIVDKGVTAEELQRAKRQKIADFVYSRQTADSIASSLATDYLSTGDVNFSRNYTKHIQAVTAEQVHQAARKYFNFDAMAITRMSPKAPAAATSAPHAHQKHARRVFRLTNGMCVILQPAEAGLVSMVYVTRGGVLAETGKTNGLGRLMAAMSTRGTKNYSAKKIDEFFDRAGGSISGKSGNNSFYWQATVLKDSSAEAMAIFADVILQPKFTKKELEILRPIMLSNIKKVDEDWTEQLHKFFRSKFFAASAYHMVPTGQEKVVKGATVKQIRKFHRKNIAGAKKSVLAVFGEFDPEKLTGQIEKLFDANITAAKSIEVISKPRTLVSPDAPAKLHVLKTDNKQAGIIVAAGGMTIDNVRDRLAMNVLDTVISGYNLPSGWLHTELRGKRLVYVVHAYNWAGLKPGAFVTYAGCEPQNAKQVVKIILKNLRRAAKYTPTQKEIDLAVNSILTAEVLQSQTMGDLAMSAALDELYGLGHDFHKKQEKLYRAITPKDVAAVAKRYLSGGFAVFVTTPRPELVKSLDLNEN